MVFFLIHLLVWFLLDYALIKLIQGEPFTQFLFPVLFLILLLSTLHRFHVVIVDAYGDVCDNFVFLTQESIFD